MKSHYDTLGIDRDAQPGQIKSAFKKMALRWHPDKNKESRAHALEQFQEVNEAYNTLSKQDLKQAYDVRLVERESEIEFGKYMQAENETYDMNQQQENDFLTKEEKDILNNFSRRMEEQGQQVKKKIRKTRRP